MLEHTFKNNPAPNSVAQMEKDHVPCAATCALPVLAERRSPSVIFHDCADAKALFEDTNQRELLETVDAMGANRDTAPRVNWPTKRDANPRKLVWPQTSTR
jgi:hypothetical protein